LYKDEEEKVLGSEEEGMKKNKVIQCKKCKQDFVWSSEEQEYYKEKDLRSPVYCLICRSIYSEAKKDDFRGKIN